MADQLLTTPEAGRMLGIEPEDIYRLIFAGELDGKPDRTGQVKITASEVERYRSAHAGA
jgi:hypothetical protein